jgi:cytidylate kinase
MPRYIEEIVSEQVRRSEIARQRSAESGKPCPCNVITISRRMGSGARVVAIKLSEQLGWGLWGKDLIDAVAEDANVSKRVADAFDERTHSEIELFISSILGDFDMGGFIFPTHLARAVASVAALGNVIILGRGANFLLPDALHIRIDASDERRIQNMMSYENLTREEAVKKLAESDRERWHYLTKTFGRDRVENFHYDISLWMDKFTSDDAVEIVKTAIRCRCPAI